MWWECQYSCTKVVDHVELCNHSAIIVTWKLHESDRIIVVTPIAYVRDSNVEWPIVCMNYFFLFSRFISCIICNKYEEKKGNAIKRWLEEDVTYPTLAKWVQGAVREAQRQGQPMEELDVLALCCPPVIITLRYQWLKAYGNHYQVSSCSTHGMVNCDCGVASTFNQRHMQVRDEDVAIHYDGVLKDICLLNYGLVSSPTILMRCKWVQNGINIKGNLTYWQDEVGFLLANFRYIMAKHEEPFFFHPKPNMCFL